MNNKQLVLASRIRADLDDIKTIVKRTQSLFLKVANDEDYLDGVALNLHSFYTSVESVFEAIAKDIDGFIPKGNQWHRDLLKQMSTEISGIRPFVIKSNSIDCLDTYRGFRHVIRHIYTFNLEITRIEELVKNLSPCYLSLEEDLMNFCDFLEQL